MDAITAPNEPKFVGIHCVTKWKRVLLHLGDFFIVFLLSLLLFHIGTYPLGRVIVGYDSQLDSLHQAQERRDGLLYDERLLFPMAEGKRTYADFEENLAYTAELFARGFVEQNKKYDVFATYFLDIRQNSAQYISFYRAIDEGHGFFDITADSVTLKASYVEEFKPKWNPDDTMSAKGQEDYQAFENKIFAQGYNRMLNDLLEKDLVRGDVSYVKEQSAIADVLKNGRMLVVTCAIATFLLVWMVNHLLIPTLSKKRKTLGMMFLRVERIHKDTYEPLSIPIGYLASIYALAGEMACIIFIPWGTTNFNELFSLPLLFPIALISLAYIIGSFVALLLDAYNRSLGDFLCRSYVLPEDEFDTLVREKGYGA